MCAAPATQSGTPMEAVTTPLGVVVLRCVTQSWSSASVTTPAIVVDRAARKHGEQDVHFVCSQNQITTDRGGGLAGNGRR